MIVTTEATPTAISEFTTELPSLPCVQASDRFRNVGWCGSAIELSSNSSCGFRAVAATKRNGYRNGTVLSRRRDILALLRTGLIRSLPYADRIVALLPGSRDLRSRIHKQPRRQRRRNSRTASHSGRCHSPLSCL